MDLRWTSLGKLRWCQKMSHTTKTTSHVPVIYMCSRHMNCSRHRLCSEFANGEETRGAFGGMTYVTFFHVFLFDVTNRPPQYCHRLIPHRPKSLTRPQPCMWQSFQLFKRCPLLSTPTLFCHYGWWKKPCTTFTSIVVRLYCKRSPSHPLALTLR